MQKQGWSRRKIVPFINKMKVNTDELLHPLEDFISFKDFFIREIDLSKRSIHMEQQICIAPADGKYLAYSEVPGDSTFRIKRHSFNMREMVGDEDLSRQYHRGSMVICRIGFSDYHHFHFPDTGLPGEAVSVRGTYHASGPYSLSKLVPFYTENHRKCTIFETDNFGRVIFVEIGAFTVGSIQQRYQPGVRVVKGSRKGFFSLGGSTIVLLFKRDAIEVDEDLLNNTKKEIETYIRFGDSIGRASG
jgi:phosphatidylserine decarboxylase